MAVYKTLQLKNLDRERGISPKPNLNLQKYVL